MTRRNARHLFVWALVPPLLAGCAARDRVSVEGDPQLATYLDLMLPQRIELQRFLTQPVSFAANGNADAIEVVLAAYDANNDLTKVVGTFDFELELRPRRETIGTRVATWRIPVDSEKALREYRDSLSRYYTFPLKLPEPPLKVGEYVLSAWVQLPAGRRLFAEYEFTYDGKGAPPAKGM
jgi:hypothetical protein